VGWSHIRGYDSALTAFGEQWMWSGPLGHGYQIRARPAHRRGCRCETWNRTGVTGRPSTHGAFDLLRSRSRLLKWEGQSVWRSLGEGQSIVHRFAWASMPRQRGRRHRISGIGGQSFRLYPPCGDVVGKLAESAVGAAGPEAEQFKGVLEFDLEPSGYEALGLFDHHAAVQRSL
jgi:hypothetical protein